MFFENFCEVYKYNLFRNLPVIYSTDYSALTYLGQRVWLTNIFPRHVNIGQWNTLSVDYRPSPAVCLTCLCHAMTLQRLSLVPELHAAGAGGLHPVLGLRQGLQPGGTGAGDHCRGHDGRRR